MYREGKDRIYVTAAAAGQKGRFAGGRTGTLLRLEKKQDLFTCLDYFEAVDGSGRRARIGIVDSQRILAETTPDHRYRCYYVKTQAPGREILVFCAGAEGPDDEWTAALFEMPDFECT